MANLENYMFKDENGKLNFDYQNILKDYQGNIGEALRVDNMECEIKDDAVSVQFIVLLVIFFAGIILNAVVIWMIVILREYKKTAHWYVLQLAIADSIFLIMLPLKATQELKGMWVFSEAACHAHQAVFYVNYYASIFFLTAMSFDRYVAILHPVSSRWRQMRSGKGSSIIVVIVWILAIFACLPVVMYSSITSCRCGFRFPMSLADKCEHIKVKNLTTCRMVIKELELLEKTTIPYNHTDGDFEQTFAELGSAMEEYYTPLENMTDFGDADDSSFEEYERGCKHPPSYYYKRWTFANMTLAFLLPVFVMVVCYGCILWRVTHPRVRRSNPSVAYPHRKQSSSSSSDAGVKTSILSSRSKKNSTSSSGSSNNKKTHRITALVVVLVASFIACWLPFHVVLIARFYGVSLGIDCDLLTTFARDLAFFNSVLNPFLYTFMSVNFERRFRSAWRSFTRPFQSQSRVASSVFLKSNGSRNSRASNNLAGRFTKETLVTDGTSVSTNQGGQQTIPLKTMNSEN